MAEISIDWKKEHLRMTCGQCGDTQDMIFNVEGDKLVIELIDSEDETSINREHAPECYSKFIHVIS